MENKEREKRWKKSAVVSAAYRAWKKATFKSVKAVHHFLPDHYGGATILEYVEVYDSKTSRPKQVEVSIRVCTTGLEISADTVTNYSDTGRTRTQHSYIIIPLWALPTLRLAMEESYFLEQHPKGFALHQQHWKIWR